MPFLLGSKQFSLFCFSPYCIITDFFLKKSTNLKICDITPKHYYTFQVTLLIVSLESYNYVDNILKIFDG